MEMAAGCRREPAPRLCDALGIPASPSTGEKTEPGHGRRIQSTNPAPPFAVTDALACTFDLLADFAH